MAALALLVVAGALAAAAALARPQAALGVVLGTLVLVPGSVPLPAGPGALTVHRLVVLAALAGLLRRALLREVPWRVFALPPVASRFVLVAGLLAVVGVGLLQPTTLPAAASRSWVGLAFPLVVLVVVVALARAADRPGAGVTALALAVVGSAVIAVAEHATGSSYTRFWYRAVPELLLSDPAQVLARRGGQVRVRGAADFTLAYAWATAACLPLLVVATTRLRGAARAALLAALPLVLLAVVWTYSRSVVLPMVVAVVLVVLVVVRDRLVQAVTVAVVAVGTALVLATPSLLRDFTVEADRGSIDVRVDRLPAVFDLASGHPFRGLGLSGLASLGVPTTDSSYLLGYAEVGALGLAALVALLLAGCAAAYGGMRAVDRPARAVSVAAGTGALLLVLGALSFDAFTTPSTAELFWVLVALGLVAGERGGARPLSGLPVLARVGGVLGLLVVGLVVRAAAPDHVAQTWQFETLQPYVATALAPSYTGVQLRSTACDVVEADLRGTRSVAMSCRPLGDGPGQGLLRLQARDAAGLRALALREVAVIRRVPTLERLVLVPRGPAEEGTPAALRTAPVWLPVAGLVWLLPVPRRRREQA